MKILDILASVVLISASVLVGVWIGNDLLTPRTVVVQSYAMQPSQFDTLTKGTGAIYVPYTGSGDHYELVGIAVVVGNVNDRIRVIVLDRNGQPAFNVMVRHSFGTDFEQFPFVGDPVQFNLGVGSHYSVPDDPPDHITVQGLPSDEVRVGNANIIGFQHTDFQMTFQLKGTAIPTPVVPTPTATTPIGSPTPYVGDCVTKEQFHACFLQEMRNMANGAR